MNAIADKLEENGYDTFEARFVVIATDALRTYPNSTVDAWRYIGAVFGLAYLDGIRTDMANGQVTAIDLPTLLQMDIPASKENLSKPYQARRKPDPERIRAVKSKIVQIVFGYKMSDGRDVADVGAHEMDRFARDGALMRELKKEMPVLSGNMRFAPLREIISREQFEAAKKRAGI